jgi:bifunctional DNA-binding transcriptional regulator/antitoxin component of YhaV-PrlF toxin-antitoxin module
MKAAIVVDEVGRLVLPKTIRLAIGLTGRATVSVEVVGQSVHLTPPEQRSGPVSRKRGRMIYTGQLPKGWHSGEAVAEMRERRVRR